MVEADAPISARAFAKRIGESQSQVAGLAAAGRLVLASDGKRIHPAASIARLRELATTGAADVDPIRTASFSEFAKLIGAQPSYVTQLKAAGRLVLTTDGKRVLVQESIATIRETADPAKDGVRARHAAGRGDAADGGGQGDGADGDDAADSFEPQSSDAKRRAKALADKAETDAKAAERDYRISMGELLDVADVEQAARTAAATLRNGLENLANTLAPELSAETDEGKVRVILADAIEHALDELSRQFAAIAKAEVTP